jgi:acyl carrier protein
MGDGEIDPAIEAKVIEIIVDQLDVSKDQVSLETRFVDDLGADSLDIAELQMEFEDTFDLNIPDDEDNAIASVGDAVRFIQNNAKG